MSDDILFTLTLSLAQDGRLSLDQVGTEAIPEPLRDEVALGLLTRAQALILEPYKETAWTGTTLAKRP